LEHCLLATDVVSSLLSGFDDQIILWDVATGEDSPGLTPLERDAEKTSRFSPDDARLASHAARFQSPSVDCCDDNGRGSGRAAVAIRSDAGFFLRRSVFLATGCGQSREASFCSGMLRRTSRIWDGSRHVQLRAKFQLALGCFEWTCLRTGRENPPIATRLLHGYVLLGRCHQAPERPQGRPLLAARGRFERYKAVTQLIPFLGNVTLPVTDPHSTKDVAVLVEAGRSCGWITCRPATRWAVRGWLYFLGQSWLLSSSAFLSNFLLLSLPTRLVARLNDRFVALSKNSERGRAGRPRASRVSLACRCCRGNYHLGPFSTLDEVAVRVDHWSVGFARLLQTTSTAWPDPSSCEAGDGRGRRPSAFRFVLIFRLFFLWPVLMSLRSCRLCLIFNM